MKANTNCPGEDSLHDGSIREDGLARLGSAGSAGLGHLVDWLRCLSRLLSVDALVRRSCQRADRFRFENLRHSYTRSRGSLRLLTRPLSWLSTKSD